MRSLIASSGLACVLVSLASPNAIADEGWIRRHRPTHLAFEVGAFGGVALFSDDHNLQDLDITAQEPPSLGHQRLRPGPDFGLRLAFFPLSFLGIEAEGGLILSRSDEDGESAPIFLYRGHGILQLPGFRIVPFLLAGLGAMNLRSDDGSLGKDVDPAFHFGGGVKLAITRHLTVRVDFRDDMIQKNRLLPGVEDGDLVHNFEILAGFSFTHGRTPARAPAPSDSDGDGFLDGKDACPREPGVAPDGCPAKAAPPADGDGDGVVDADDRCPTEKEDRLPPDASDGCPTRDADGDGILIPDDQCPAEKGPAPTGCPIKDTDGDGLLDDVDKCVDQPETRNGFEDADGCPDVIPKAVAKFTGVIHGIHFATNKAIIRKPSRRLLDRAAAVLQQYPELRIEISGHTDSRGKREKNVALSQARADAVKAYLTGKGVDGARIETRGAGPDEPIADNKTARGRTKNRRIEFKLLTQ